MIAFSKSLPKQIILPKARNKTIDGKILVDKKSEQFVLRLAFY